MKKMWIVACLAIVCAAGCGQTAEKPVESLVVNETWIAEEMPVVKAEESTGDEKAIEPEITKSGADEMETVEIKGNCAPRRRAGSLAGERPACEGLTNQQ